MYLDSAGAACEGERPHAACYLQPAPLLDVMFEQLGYLVGHLVSHAGGVTVDDCPDCQRFQEVRFWLLSPFAE